MFSPEFRIININDNIHYYSFDISTKGRITLSDGKNLYLLNNNKLVKMYENTNYKERIIDVNWLNDGKILIYLSCYFFHISIEIFDIFNINTNQYENLIHDLGYKHIIRDKNLYIYNDNEFESFNNMSYEEHKYALQFNSVDVSYDEKTIIYSTNNKIILLNVEDNTTKEFNISNVVKLKVSIDNKYLLIGINVNNFISVKILNITNNQISDFVENVTDFFWMI
ncbi:MAG: hypothetical protein QXP04_04705 [Candidatus Nanoarchaeia archaeon]|nr:hypothetical protein [Candidatus Jingweiarchaeum tengchongense]